MGVVVERETWKQHILYYHVLGERDTCGGQEGVGVGPYVQQTDRQPKQSKAGWRCCVCAALWK